MVPLAIKLGVVLDEKSIEAVVGGSRLFCSFSITCLMVALCHQEFSVHLICRLHGISNNLEKRRTIFRRQVIHHHVNLVRDALVIIKTRLGRAVCKRQMRVVQAVVLITVPLHLISHKFRASLPCQTVISVEHALKVFLILLAKDRSQPCGLTPVGIIIRERIHVPCHVEELLHFHLHRFYVTNIQEPIAIGSCIESLFQFLIHEHWRCARNPQIVMRSAKITQMVVHARCTAALSLIVIAHTLHVSIIVIRPHKGDVFRHFQTCIINVERLLVWHKYLRNGRSILAFAVMKNLSLVSKHFLQCASTHLGI